jgi:hypothetical protein
MANDGSQRRQVLKILAALGIGGTEICSAAAQEPNAAHYAGGKIVFENEKVRVISHLGRPRLGVCGIGLHSHPPHLTVVLTDVKAKLTLPGKDPQLVQNASGDVFWDPGGPHIVENVGSRDSKVYLVELKAT